VDRRDRHVHCVGIERARLGGRGSGAVAIRRGDVVSSSAGVQRVARQACCFRAGLRSASRGRLRHRDGVACHDQQGRNSRDPPARRTG
jgi:hypothetical protein